MEKNWFGSVFGTWIEVLPEGGMVMGWSGFHALRSGDDKIWYDCPGLESTDNESGFIS